MNEKWEKSGILAGGVLLGTAGVKLLASKDAKKVYTQATAGVLRAKECIMTTVTRLRENAEDVMADAKEINEARQKEEKIIEDASEQK